jgi:hypothetical protein
MCKQQIPTCVYFHRRHHWWRFKHRFSVNVWCDWIGNQLTGPFLLEQRLTADNYLNFLTKEFPRSMEDVPLEKRRGIFLKHDRPPPHFVRQVTAYLNQLRRASDLSSWSNNSAAEISGPNTAWHLFVWSNERHDLQDQITHERGTPASNYGCLIHLLGIDYFSFLSN